MFKIFYPNMLKVYELCTRKFHFKYIKKLSMPVNDDIFTLGKNIHALASYYLKKEYIDKMELALNEKEQSIWKYLKGIEYFSYEYINTEYALTIKLEDYFFGGRLDALVKKNDTYYILDYKTGSAPKNAKYDYQTMIYMLAVSYFFQTDKVKFIYIDLKNKTEVKIDLSDELINEYKSRLIDIAKKINMNDYLILCNITKSDDKICCKHCEYKKICY